MTAPKALREMCEQVLASGLKSAAAKTIARALLDRLSGETVTPDVIKNAREFLAEDEFPDEDGAMREQYIESIRHLVALMALSADRNAVIEKCAAVVDRGWVAADNLPMYLGAVSKAIRELKSS